MDSHSQIDASIGRRLRALRTGLGLSLDDLARRSGVSRSMISVAERGESSPTARVLDKLAATLGVPLASLFVEQDEDAPPAPLSRRAEQQLWRDPETGYERRALSPAAWPSAISLTEVRLPAGASVAYDGRPAGALPDQQLWVLSGSLEVAVGHESHRLETGDCLAFQPHGPTRFRNLGAGEARYLIAVAAAPAPTTAGKRGSR